MTQTVISLLGLPIFSPSHSTPLLLPLRLHPLCIYPSDSASSLSPPPTPPPSASTTLTRPPLSFSPSNSAPSASTPLTCSPPPPYCSTKWLGADFCKFFVSRIWQNSNEQWSVPSCFLFHKIIFLLKIENPDHKGGNNVCKKFRIQTLNHPILSLIVAHHNEEFIVFCFQDVTTCLWSQIIWPVTSMFWLSWMPNT